MYANRVSLHKYILFRFIPVLDLTELKIDLGAEFNSLQNNVIFRVKRKTLFVLYFNKLFRIVSTYVENFCFNVFLIAADFEFNLLFMFVVSLI